MTAEGWIHVEHVMGTTVTLDIRDTGLPREQLTNAVNVAIEVLHRADQTFSTWNLNSALHQSRRGAVLDADAQEDLDTVERACRSARAATNGWFNPWAMPGGYDPTGLVKGWAAQRALEAMSTQGIKHALVNAGGDLLVSGSSFGTQDGPGWRVGISDPHAPQALLQTLSITDLGVATSASYERGSLAVDPFTGRSVRRLASATVIAPNLGLADALSTAATAQGIAAIEWLRDLPGIQALLVSLEGDIVQTPEWRGSQP